MGALGKRIRHRLREIGRQPIDLTRELERAGYPFRRQTIHGWLKDKSRPSIEVIFAILDVLLVPRCEHLDWFEDIAGRAASADNRAPKGEEAA